MHKPMLIDRSNFVCISECSPRFYYLVSWRNIKEGNLQTPTKNWLLMSVVVTSKKKDTLDIWYHFAFRSIQISTVCSFCSLFIFFLTKSEPSPQTTTLITVIVVVLWFIQFSCIPSRSFCWFLQYFHLFLVCLLFFFLFFFLFDSLLYFFSNFFRVTGWIFDKLQVDNNKKTATNYVVVWLEKKKKKKKGKDQRYPYHWRKIINDKPSELNKTLPASIQHSSFVAPDRWNI